MAAPLIVFLHGLGDTPQSWQEQVTALPPGSRAVAPWLDGLRPGSGTGFDLDRAADAVLAQLNRHGVDRVALVGSGLGSSVAVRAAAVSPDAVSRLVLTGVAAAPPRLAGALQRMAVRAMPAARLAAAGLDRARLIALMRGTAGIDLRTDLPRITAATLVVAGDAGQADLPAARALAAGISGARLELVPRSGHRVELDVPAAFNRLLYEFLG